MPRWCALLIALFLVGHGICRALTWNHLEYDEAEQLVLVQSLEWGYYYQPPLYTWLLWPWVKLLGPTVFPLLIVRTLLYLVLFRLMYAVALRICSHERLAALIALSTLLVPEVFHGAMGMWPHTMLMTVCILATLLVILRLVKQQNWRDYLLLGLSGGLGVLSKYNYAHWVAALALAMLMLPRWRLVLLDRRMVIALLIAAAIAAPHAWWMMQHLDEVRHGVVRYTEEKQNQFNSAWASVKHVGTNIIQNVGRSNGFILVPLMLIFIPFWRKTQNDAGEAVPEFRQLLLRFFLLAAVLLSGAMILGGVHHIRQHWLTGFALLLPLLVFSGTDPGKLRNWQWRSYTGVVVFVVVGALGWRGGLILWYSEEGCLSAKSFQYATLCDELRETTWNQHAAMVDHPYTAAYLRLHFPQAHIHCLYFPSLKKPATDKQLLVSWRARAQQQRTRMQALLLSELHLTEESLHDPQIVEEPQHRLLSDNMRVMSVIVPRSMDQSTVLPVNTSNNYSR